tara:strand:+ start:1557 stop:2498 length:942 start_codon:yes stop_codon:yes gene_type:complete
MTLIKPKFWDEKIGFISIILIPFALIFLAIIFFKKKLTKPKQFKIPIICVGNIYVGGTGKTPTSIFLANEISRSGKKTTILRKYYKSHKDEHELIKKNFNNLLLNTSRINGLKHAENSNFDIAILDDGLQDHRIKKDFSIVCFNEKQLIGNGLIFPSGPLRESLQSLKKTDIVIINGDKNKKFEDKILNINKNLSIFYSLYKPVNLDEFKNKKLMAVAGIGNPNNFFQLLEENNLLIEKKLIFPDHYSFSENEIQKIINDANKKNYQIIMTEKDYYKIKDIYKDQVKFLKVMLKIENQEKLMKKINELYDKKD